MRNRCQSLLLLETCVSDEVSLNVVDEPSLHPSQASGRGCRLSCPCHPSPRIPSGSARRGFAEIVLGGVPADFLSHQLVRHML